MKKIVLTAVLVMLISLVMIAPAAADPGKRNIKGVVTGIKGDTITVQTRQGETYVVSVPPGVAIGPVDVGDTVLIKAAAGENDTWFARSVKVVGAGDDEDEDEIEIEDDDDGDAEGFRDHSAFCAEGKQEGPHPLAPKIAERYGVSADMVMDFFCDGYSMGAIMLAIKTSQMEGVDAAPGDLLLMRAEGEGWGRIWQELRLIGSEKEGHSPPGWLKRPAHAGPKK